jgi:hypothetical protein
MAQDRDLLSKILKPRLSPMTSAQDQHVWSALQKGAASESKLYLLSALYRNSSAPPIECQQEARKLAVASGIFSLMAYTMSQRAHEIGVRIAFNQGKSSWAYHLRNSISRLAPNTTLVLIQ